MHVANLNKKKAVTRVIKKRKNINQSNYNLLRLLINTTITTIKGITVKRKEELYEDIN
jgi:hypothetical protein